MVGNLQGYHKGIIIGLDYLRGLFTGEGNSLSSRQRQLQKVGATHLDSSFLLGSADVLFSRFV